MATTITPSTGAAPSFTQAGTGTSPGYSAIDVRRFFFGAPIQEGVIDAGSYEVTERAAGANMSVDIAASTGNGALVQGDSITGQGLYFVPPHSAVINEVVATADASDPRVDQIVLEILDTTHDSSGSNLARVRVISGTATTGATLDNRTGAAALPSNCLRLADLLVPAADTTCSNSQIRDRRPWARGAYYRIVRTQNAAAGSNYTTTQTSATVVDSTNLNPRIECSGVPLTIRCLGRLANGTLDKYVQLLAYQDGVAITGAAGNVTGEGVSPRAAFEAIPGSPLLEVETIPAAGSHKFAPYWLTETGTTATLSATSADAFVFVVKETVRQNTHNAQTTSG